MYPSQQEAVQSNREISVYLYPFTNSMRDVVLAHLPMVQIDGSRWIKGRTINGEGGDGG